jgi:SAM-dependent methyltransferase
MYKPYPISTFGALVNRVVLDIDPIDKDMRGLTLLEIGCGPGTKMVLAEKVFGLYTRGFDYNSAYVQAAKELLRSRSCKGHAFIADAYSGDARREYRIADIIYLNRPFVHAEQQADLERLVYDTIRSGAYIIMANHVTTPEGSWPLITQDKFAAVFRKP